MRFLRCLVSWVSAIFSAPILILVTRFEQEEATLACFLTHVFGLVIIREWVFAPSLAGVVCGAVWPLAATALQTYFLGANRHQIVRIAAGNAFVVRVV